MPTTRLLALLSTGLLALAACGGGGDGGAASWPDVPLTDSSGSEVSSSEVLATGPTVVSLWATWCQPCKRELPMLQDMDAAGDADVVGVNVGDTADAVDAFLADLGVTFPSYIDTDGELMTELDVASLPATLLVADGEVVWSHLGEVGRADVEAALVAAEGL